MLNKRVAIIQNRIHKGGRLQVILALIKVLNDLGLRPDIVTLQSQISPDGIREGYNLDLDFRFRFLRPDPRVSYEWNLLFFNRLLHTIRQEYDLFINSSNSSLLLPRGPAIISYVHFPRSYRVLTRERSIHLSGPRGRRNWLEEELLRRACRPFYRLLPHYGLGERIIANSRFSKEAITRYTQSLPEEEIEVVYPPVSIDEFSGDGRKERGSVVSLGRFTEIKNQLEQIDIARVLPEFTFYLAGFVKRGSSYFERCRRKVEREGLGNVMLLPNCSFSDLRDLVRRGSYFLHSTRNEPFGITTVQAAAAGCLPVVHDSGGQREIVPDEHLRWNSRDEAVARLRRLEALDSGALRRLRLKFIREMKRFDRSVFEEKFRRIITETVEKTL